jgi:hypothetical protein
MCLTHTLWDIHCRDLNLLYTNLGRPVGLMGTVAAQVVAMGGGSLSESVCA